MSALWPAILSAIWLGVLTAISPCPMATNLAAVAFVSRRMDHPRAVIHAGLLYTLGRSLAYTVLGWLLVQGLMAAPGVSHQLQQVMNRLLGPLLILVGMLLSGLLRVGSGNGQNLSALQNRVERWGLWGAGLLGFLFALSFCPTSAALFFGSLIPLALQQESPLVIPLLYGTFTGLPVLVFALLLSLGGQTLTRTYSRITALEPIARRLTGTLFIVVGVYFTLTHVFAIRLW